MINLARIDFKRSIGGFQLRDLFFFFYLCTNTSHNLGSGLDYYISRISFALYCLVEIIILIRERDFKLNTLILWYMAFISIYFISIAWAKNNRIAFDYIANFVQILGVFFFLSRRIKEKEDIDAVLKLIISSLIYMSILLLIRLPFESLGKVRIGSAIGLNPNSVGMMSAFGSCICLYLLTGSRKTYLKLYYIFIFVLLVFFTLLSGSRKAIGIHLVTVGFYIVAIQKREKTVKSLFIHMAAIGFIAIYAYMLLVLIMENDMLYRVMGRRLVSMVEKGTSEKSLGERQYFITEGLNLFSQQPIIGVGANNFVQHMKDVEFSHQAYSHNNFIELLSTLGIIGFVSYYWLPVWDMWKLFCFSLKNHANRQAILMFIIITSSVVFGWWNVNYINVFQQLLIGLAFLTVKISSSTMIPVTLQEQGEIHHID